VARIAAHRNLIVLAAAGLAVVLAAGARASRPSPPAGPVTESFRFEEAAPAPVAEPAARGAAQAAAPVASAPVSLTAGDGTGLRLVALAVDGVLEPPLAFTELRLTFDNPRDEVLEGRFRIVLPPGAAISRFAMKIGGAWQEGEVVERQRARRVYEDFLHRAQDPALLEQEAGNEFSARVFPIPARGRKELVVSYSHALERADQPYRLPLLGLPEIGELDVRVLLGERPVEGPVEGTGADEPASNLGGAVRDRRMVELHRRGWVPDRDLEIAQEAVAERSGLRHGELAVARVTAPVDPEPQEIAGLFVLVDSSASRALGWAEQVRRVGELISGLRDGAGAATPVGVAAFDQEVVPVYEGPAGGFGEPELARLGARRALGASDLHSALRWLGERLATAGETSAAPLGAYPRVLLVTDGVATAGEVEAHALREAVRALGDRGVERLDVLAVGGLRDDAALRELVTGNLAHDGQRIDGAAPLPEIARRLTLACRSGIAVAVEGAAWVWPETLDGVQPGDQALVFADLPAGLPLRVTLDGREAALAGAVAPAERPLLERAWVQARIERLLHLRETAHAGDPDLRRALALQVTDLSVRHRVLSPYTALLVLETEADYRRFGLERTALADVLTVGAGGLEVRARTPAAVRPEERQAVDALGYLAGRDEVAGSETPGGFDGAIEPGDGEPDGPLMIPPPRVALRLESGSAAEDGVGEVIAEEIVVDSGRRTRRLLGRPRAQPGAPAGQGVVGQPADPAADSTVEPWSGRFAEVQAALAAGRTQPAVELAEAWLAEAPGDLLALIALGEAREAAGDLAGAARAYGSLIDLFPGRADLRRLAGERLERLGGGALELAVDTYAKAAADRPDHPSGHRLLGWALLRAGRPAEAFAALETGLAQSYPAGRFAGVDRVLSEDLGLIGAAWLRAEPARRGDVLARLAAHGAALDAEPSLRFVLTWETDANDVDLHVRDRRGGHAWYEQPKLASGGELYADVTTGYGPECFTVRAPERRPAAPYRLAAHYYRRGPMGYGMGTVQVIAHDGKGGIEIESRPFVVMADDAMVDLGEIPGTKLARR
jgi:tetratricopeptide (TPR) repeat protein